MSKIIRNSAKCAYCDVELVSIHRHDFRTHKCEKAGKVSKKYDHDKREYVAAYPSFSVDGGNEYIRRVGTEQDFIETSVVEP